VKVIRGKKAVVTGAASGIGRAIALTLAAEGADVFLIDIDEGNLAATAVQCRQAGGEALTSHCDVGRSEAITASVGEILRRWGHVDILINNAGIAYYGPTERMTASQWDRLLAINLLAPIQFTRELLPTLLGREEAHIVNVCSVLGLVAVRKAAAYCASKFGLVGFSVCLRAEYAGHGLGVTTLCPGFVRTNIFRAPAEAMGAKPLRTPPRWLSTSPEKVAGRAVKAIRRDQGLVVVTPLARVLWFLQRLSPRLLAWLFRAGKKDAKNKPSATTGLAKRQPG
jgi:NAD(P)-dependent dehydrogenase (short-subunit alcohol dehydrogenase family)